ncbi:MAG: hypothetical protein A3F12_03245 [Gammaproteobacteria bacterium RIFCSPHIGHO2_12_FULL_38_14]|nr:MAG: hypothetical protein A3F12_03245 [Gammaproteobacteria bacterium RIFCSPHIGHO2_12_FULL_38_14]
MDTRKRKFPYVIDLSKEDNTSLGHENSSGDVRASLLNAYQSLLLVNPTPNEEAVKELKKINKDTCTQYLYVLFPSFSIENLKFYVTPNGIGIEIKNNSTHVSYFAKAALKLISMITGRDDITFTFNEGSLVEGKIILLFTFTNPMLSPQNELQNIFGRLALIQHIVMKKLLRWSDVAELLKSLKSDEDIVIKLIDRIISIWDSNRLNELEKRLPQIILQMLNGDYSYQLSPVFEGLPTAKNAILEFQTLSDQSQKNILKPFFHVFESRNIYHYGSNPNEIYVCNIASSYANSTSFLRYLKLLFSIVNPKVTDQFQFGVLKKQSPALSVLMLKYQEGKLEQLIEALARSVWLCSQGPKYGRTKRILGYLKALKLEQELIPTIEKGEGCRLYLPTIIITSSTETEPLLSISRGVQVVPQQDYSGSTSFIEQTLSSIPSEIDHAPPTIETQRAGHDPFLFISHEEVPRAEDTATPFFFPELDDSNAVQQFGLFPANVGSENDDDDLLRFLSSEGLDRLGPNN